MVIYPMIRFRGHHLVCLHFFHGEGYSPEFVLNLEKALDSVMLEGVEVCEGADDICYKCPSLKEAGCGYSEDADTEVLEMDRLAMDLLGVREGMKISWDELRQRLSGIFAEWFKSCCVECVWNKACEKNDSWRKLKERTLAA